MSSLGIKQRPGVAAVVAALSVVTVVLGLWWFQPQKLLIEQRVDERLPTADATRAGDAQNGESVRRRGRTGVETLARGGLRPLAHPASGESLLLELGDGSRFLRFEDLAVENGPDLRVYLAKAAADSEASSFDDDFVDLGALKGNSGDQNYRLPDEVDPSAYRSVVIWCRRFSVGFAVAPLQAPPDRRTRG